VARYRGLVTAVYMVQLLVSATVGIIVASGLVAAFAHRPLFDKAMAGDLVALVAVIRSHWHLFLALAWAGVFVALLYGALSWFLKGGLISVFLSDQERLSAGAIVRRFGASGATTFLPYGRLALWSLIPYAVSGLLLAFGYLAVRRSAVVVLDMGDVAAALVPLAPGLLAAAVVRTAMDYARIEISRNPGIAAWRALVRCMRFVVTHPRTLLHFAIYCIAFIAVSALYLAVTWDRPMTGGVGVLVLFLIRQSCALLRYAAHVALIAGQVAFSRE
jgi:hypothetical protein